METTLIRNRVVLQWIYDRYQRGEDVIVATVIETFDRSPYPAGSMMAFDRYACFEGSVSSGCVEADLYERARAVFDGHRETLSGIGCQIIDFESDRPDADLLAAPGPCHGTLRIALHPVTPLHFPEFGALVAAVHDDRPAWTFLNLQTGRTSLTQLDDSSSFRVHYERPARMLIFGSSDIATVLAALALRVNYAVTVCEPRSAFLSAERFGSGVALVRDWPDRYLRQERSAGRVDADTAIVDLAHDDRFSIPLLAEALDSRRWCVGAQPGFVGALGSRSRSLRKRQTLCQQGLRPDDVNRLQAPIGLDLGGRGAADIALSILAQVVATANGGSGLPLARVPAAGRPADGESLAASDTGRGGAAKRATLQ